MRSSLRKSLAVSAVMASSVAAAVIGSGSAQAAPSGPSSSPLTISDGTASVTVGSRSVHFPGSVTDAAWSPDGSRVAYIDGHGQLATANATGGDVQVLTSGPAVRSHPTWEDGGSEIVFAQIVNGASKLMSVDANGLTMGKPTVAVPVPETQNDGADSAPDAAFRQWDPAKPDLPFVSKLVYQHQDPAGPQVWILDRNTRGPAGVKVADGTDPSIAPDGSAVAFVDPDGQIETVALPVPFDAQGHPQPVFTKVTTGTATTYSHLTWSPDGKTIAAEGMTPGASRSQDAPKDVETVAADGKSAPVVVRSSPGTPAYQPLTRDTVSRIDGADRIGTAIAASKAVWATDNGTVGPMATAQNVVLSRTDQFADALGGSALANHVNGPLLLTDTAGLNPAVKAEIQRVLGAPSPAGDQYKKTVYLLGGEKALSPAVFNAAKALGYEVVRIGGADRFATSVAVADAITGMNGTAHNPPAKIFVATGEMFPDALSAGAAASRSGAVVVLTDDKKMPAATSAYLNRTTHNGAAGSVPVFAIGGQADAALRSIGYSTAGAKQFTPVWGADRYATSLLVAEDFFDGPATVGFATGVNWADALSGGALMGRLYGPMLLTDPKDGPTADVLTWLRHSAPQLNRALIFGGNVAVHSSVDPIVGGAISGPAGYASVENPTGLPS